MGIIGYIFGKGFRGCVLRGSKRRIDFWSILCHVKIIRG